MDEKGEKLKYGRVSNLRSELKNFLLGIGEVKAVVEAGRSSYTMVDLLDEIGIDVTIAHPKEVKAIVEAKIKTDKRDSWMLANLLRTDLIPEVYKRSRENRESQRVLRQRAFYVGSITRVKNRIHALLSQQSEDVQEQISRVRNLFGTKGMKVLKGFILPGSQKELLEALVKTFSHLEERRTETNGLVEKLYFEIPEARLIHTVPGFGVFLSVLTEVEIADIWRFENVRKFHSYGVPWTSCMADEGRSFGDGLQEKSPNRPELHM